MAIKSTILATIVCYHRIIAMVTKITRERYRQIMRERKNWPKKKAGFLVFRAPDGKFYQTDKSGMKGAEEMTKWNKKIKDEMSGQTSII
jgi:hypothetical protein